MPDQWTKLLKGSGITQEDAAKNPQAVLDVLEFYTEQTKREAEQYGSSQLQGAVERMSDDRWAALLQESKKSPSTPIPTSIRAPPPRPAPPPPLNSSLPTKKLNDRLNDLSLQTSVSLAPNFKHTLHCTITNYYLGPSIKTFVAPSSRDRPVSSLRR